MIYMIILNNNQNNYINLNFYLQIKKKINYKNRQNNINKF